MSEDEGKARKAQKKGGKPQKARAWLKEGEEDDPLNFLDPTVSQRVLGNIRCLHFDFSKKEISCHGISFNMFLYYFSHQPKTEKECQG